MILSPEQYYTLREEGYTDEELAPELTKQAGVGYDQLIQEGYSPGELARAFSGIDEIDYQNTANAVPDRGVLGTLMSDVVRGTGEATQMVGHALKTADPDGGLSIGDKAGDALLSLEQYARKNLDLMKPDISEATGQEDIVTRGVRGGIRALPLAVTTMLPAVLLAPFTGGSSLVAGATAFAGGAAIFGLGTYGQSAERMKRERPDATDQEIHNYALKQGMIEGGLEAVSNVLTVGILKLAKPAGISVGESIKQIIKTPPKQLAKMWGLETLQETTTESLQGGLGAQVDLTAGMGNTSVQEGMVESIIPAVVMSSIFWVGGTSLNATRKTALLHQLNNPEGEKRAEASEQIAKLLVKEGEVELAQSWRTMTIDRIKEGKPINIHQDILKFDPNAKVEDKIETEEAATEPIKPGGVAGETTEIVEPTETVDLSVMQDTDLIPYSKKNERRPYKNKNAAEGAIKTRKFPEGENREDYTAVEVKGGAVIRKNVTPTTIVQKKKSGSNVAEQAGFTQEEYDKLTPEQQTQAKAEIETKSASEIVDQAGGKIVVDKKAKTTTPGVTATTVTSVPVPENLDKTVTQLPEAIVKQLADKIPAAQIKFDGEQDRTALKKGPLYYFTPQEGAARGRSFTTESLQYKDIVKAYTQVLAGESESQVGKSKTTILPYKGSNESVKEMSEFDPAEAREEKQLTKIQQVALEQTRSAILEENDFVPWPVVHTNRGTGNGEINSANLSWINEPAISAMPKEERPSEAVTIQTLRALEKKGFIKQADYTDGKNRWVPANWSSPISTEIKTKKAEPKVMVKRKLDTGGMIEEEITAKQAIKESDDQLSALEKLIHCME